MIYFAIAKMGATPIDGVTKVNPEGLTVGMQELSADAMIFHDLEI